MVLALLLAACNPSAPPAAAPADDRPDVLLVTIDTLRADRVGCYGDPKAQTPMLDALAAHGALFRDAETTVPLTLPAHTSLLTGLYPSAHGMRDNAGFRLQDQVVTLAERLQAAGYATAAFVSAFVLDDAWGLGQGFDTYHAPFHPADLARIGAFGEAEVPSAETVNAAQAWWRDHAGDQPRFAWVHLYDPHTPWTRHAGWSGDPYRGEVHWADQMVGRLLRAVEAAPRRGLGHEEDHLLVVVAGDHGEGLWDHGERQHGVLIGRSVTRVPLIVRPPGGLDGAEAPEPRPGEDAARRPDGVDPDLDLEPVPDAPRAAHVVDVPVSLVDVAPTIAAYAGLDPTGGADAFQGRSLKPAIEGGQLDVRPIYAETFYARFHFGWHGLLMAEDGRRRVESGVRDVVTDPIADPAGLRPLDEPVPDNLAQAIARWRGDQVPTPGPIDSQTIQQLSALGYLTVSAPQVDETADPRDRIGLATSLRLAEGLPPERAVPALEALVKKAPHMAEARISLALAKAHAGDYAGALADTEAVLKEWPEEPTALGNAGILAQKVGDLDKMLGYARRLQALNPHDARGWRLEAAVGTQREDPKMVTHAAEKGIEAAPDDPNLHYLLGLAEVQAGDPLRGAEELEAARRFGSRAKDIALWTAYGYEKAERIDQAKEWYERATREAPQDLRAWAMAGRMLYQADRCEEALPFLVNVAKRGGAGDKTVREALTACEKQVKVGRTGSPGPRGLGRSSALGGAPASSATSRSPNRGPPRR